MQHILLLGTADAQRLQTLMWCHDARLADVAALFRWGCNTVLTYVKWDPNEDVFIEPTACAACAQTHLLAAQHVPVHVGRRYSLL
jgi:hypothetical protein